jgi:hypothetical protein
VFAADGDLPSEVSFAIMEDPTDQPNKNRIAFWVPSREDVDWIAAVIRDTEAKIMSEPKLFPEYSCKRGGPKNT